MLLQGASFKGLEEFPCVKSRQHGVQWRPDLGLNYGWHRGTLHYTL